MLYRTEAIVIRSMDYGEGHKILSLYSRELGKVSVIARGAKKVKSRHSGVTQLFTRGDFVFYRGGGQMGTLNQGELLASHHKLREDLHKAAYASYIAEMANRLTPENEPNEMLFIQINAAFDAIENDKDAEIVTAVIEMKMLALAGYLPRLDECVSCGNDEGPMALSDIQGGILCPLCRSKDPTAIEVTPGTLKLLRLFQQLDLRRLGTIEVKPETKAQVKQAMRAFMDMHMGVKWKARSFLEQMEKYEL